MRIQQLEPRKTRAKRVDRWRPMRMNKNNINKSEWQAGSDLVRCNQQWTCCARCVFGAANKWNLFISQRNDINLNKCIPMKLNSTEANTPSNTKSIRSKPGPHHTCSVLNLMRSALDRILITKPIDFRRTNSLRNQYRFDLTHRIVLTRNCLITAQFIYRSIYRRIHGCWCRMNGENSIKIRAMCFTSTTCDAWCALSFQENLSVVGRAKCEIRSHNSICCG